MHLEQTCPSPHTRRRDRRGDACRTGTANDDIRVVLKLEFLRGFFEMIGGFSGRQRTAMQGATNKGCGEKMTTRGEWCRHVKR